MEKRESRPNPAEHGNWSNRLILTPRDFTLLAQSIPYLSQNARDFPSLTWSESKSKRLCARRPSSYARSVIAHIFNACSRGPSGLCGTPLALFRFFFWNESGMFVYFALEFMVEAQFDADAKTHPVRYAFLPWHAIKDEFRGCKA
jgi:hypothetical protein